MSETETAIQPDAEETRDETCPMCDGTGEVDGETCPECDGTGEVPETDSADAPAEKASALQPDLEQRKRKAAMLAKTREQRTASVGDLEMRAADDGTLTLIGLACRTGVEYQVGGFREIIMPAAFKRTLSENPDVQLLVNHGIGGGLPLARTRSGTLRLSETSEGLAVEADLDPDDPDAQSLARKMRRGDVSSMSFAFQVTSDEWSETWDVRTVKSVSLHRGDVSVVNQGANPSAFASVRSQEALAALAARPRSEILDAFVEWRDYTLLPLEERAGKALSAATVEVLTQVLNLVAAADEAVDEAQPLLAELLGVPNPDSDDDDGTEPDADDAPARAWTAPDHTTAAFQRLAVLRARGGH